MNYMRHLLIVLLLATAIVRAEAWTIGGEIGFEHNDTHDMPAVGNITNGRYDTFTFNPWIEYDLSDAWTVGTYVEMGWHKDKSTGPSERQVSIGLAPYLHYTVLEFGKFSLGFEGCLRGVLSDAFGNGSDRFDSFVVGFTVKPDLSYALTDHWNLDMDLNFAALSVLYAKDGIAGAKDSRTFHAGMDLDSDNVLNVGDLSVGVSYSF